MASLDLPRAAYEELLAELVATVIGTERPAPPELVAPATATPGAAPAGVLTPASRREELLIQAMRMFASRGYTQVGMEDIGSAVGIAGPASTTTGPPSSTC